MHPYEVLIRPLLSEKSNRSRENQGKYSFHVHLNATKGEIKSAVEKMFDVKVTGVTTTVTRGKMRRRGNNAYKTANAKKAVVTLVEGSKISVFEDL